MSKEWWAKEHQFHKVLINCKGIVSFKANITSGTATEIGKAPRASFIVFPQQLSDGLAVALFQRKDAERSTATTQVCMLVPDLPTTYLSIQPSYVAKHWS